MDSCAKKEILSRIESEFGPISPSRMALLDFVGEGEDKFDLAMYIYKSIAMPTSLSNGQKFMEDILFLGMEEL